MTNMFLDVRDGFDIWGHPDLEETRDSFRKATLGRGEKLEVTCGAADSASAVFLKNNREIYGDSKLSQFFEMIFLTSGNLGYHIERSHTEYSERIKLLIDYIEIEDEAEYSCRICELANDGCHYHYINFSIAVSEPWPPIINDTNMDDNKELLLHQPLELFCISDGIPRPQMKWFKVCRFFGGCMFEVVRNGLFLG